MSERSSVETMSHGAIATAFELRAVLRLCSQILTVEHDNAGGNRQTLMDLIWTVDGVAERMNIVIDSLEIIEDIEIKKRRTLIS